MMHKRLSPTLSSIKLASFPASYNQRRRSHSVIVGIGGNLGDVCRRFERLIHFLMHDSLLSLHESSPILKNPPFGFTQQDDFHNAVLRLSTDMTPRPFLRHLLHIEKRFARKRSFKNAPRTLDLDMLFYDDLVMKHKDLTLPHPAWQKRESVLIPLAYLSKHR